MSVDWNDVKVFLAVARANSIRGAAESLKVPSARPVPHTSLWVLIHPDLRDSVRLRRFREYLYDVISDKLDLIEGRGP